MRATETIARTVAADGSVKPLSDGALDAGGRAVLERLCVRAASDDLSSTVSPVMRASRRASPASLFALPGDGYSGRVWIIIVAAILVLLLVGWRLLLVARHRAGPSRPIDSGHPHLTDVDPHDAP